MKFQGQIPVNHVYFVPPGNSTGTLGPAVETTARPVLDKHNNNDLHMMLLVLVNIILYS
jgi:hypothetical protein